MTEKHFSAISMTSEQWQIWITDYSDQWFETADDDDLERADLTATGLTSPSAGDDAIARVEARLGQRLPPSLRSFYQVTDGLLEADAFGERVLSLTEVGWMRDRYADLLDTWPSSSSDVEPDTLELMRRALQIGDDDDGAYWLLDPEERTGDEWVAYAFRTTDGTEPERYDSFATMMFAQRTALDELRNRE
ncbi:SMI1/KNR4 family protein [Actinoplanes sp. TBRC 11911]|uniref:SMI1/KNR4 family protein n=1 Tax=Actinoplanes sp. TBRC 11911 TaxID=2729386 RepID=UPI00145F0DBB|nr:SMI1/KNR4 family protein [Actinoplanes sp. TBRC 11911]NMO53339.1 SMI1/KNR4 family protein [Actinoplanes sp. TBRC 11911]